MAIQHKFKKGESLFSTTLSASISTGTGETITPASVVGLPTDTEITLTVDRVDTNGNATPAKLERITGTISGGNLTSYTRGTDGTTEQAHASGAVVEYIWNSQDWNDLVDGLLVGHNQDGTHDFATLYDTNGNEQIKLTATASAVNEITITNAATGNAPEISATGGDTNIDLKLKGKGTGTVEIYNPTSTAYEAAVGETGWIPAGETWTYASADDPTFTFTIAGVDLTTKYTAGMKIKLTQTTAKYFIITKVAFSTDTTVTVYGGTDYNLDNAAITSPYYSPMKAPAGFPLDPTKWRVIVTDTANRSQGSPSASTWYNVNSHAITIPIGAWRVTKSVIAATSGGTTTIVNVLTTLSTANNSESDSGWTDFNQIQGASGTMSNIASQTKTRFLVLDTADVYYLNISTLQSSVSSLNERGDLGTTTLEAVCAYL